MSKKIKLIILIVLGVILLFTTANLFTGKEKQQNKGEKVVENKVINEYTPLEEIT